MSEKIKDSEIKIVIKHNNNYTVSDSELSIKANVADAIFAAISLLEWAVNKENKLTGSPVGLSTHMVEAFNALAKSLYGEKYEKDQD